MSSAHTELSAIVADVKSELSHLNIDSAYVGFSGGVDSTLLLWLAAETLGADNVTALHVNHRLSEHADRWQDHCTSVARQLGCRIQVLSGEVTPDGKGVEAAARSLRYSLFEQQLVPGSTLLLGHHLDDQVETFFLRLLRGAGIQGLKAMSRTMRRADYQVHRPLLDLPRTQIESLSAALGLSWIEDESNADEKFDRNFLRQSVLPLIETRWPAYRERIHTTIDLLGQNQPEQTFDVDAELAHRISHDGGLKLVQLSEFGESQLLTLLHAWIRSLGLQVPSKSRLQAILSDVVLARADAAPAVSLGAGAIRRHGPALYWVADLPEPGVAPQLCIGHSAAWSGVGEIALVPTDEPVAISADLPDLHWRLRTVGEQMRPYGRSKQRDLKRLLQEYRIKPWLRSRMPLLFSGNTLIAAGDELISADHLAKKGQSGLKVIWRKA